MLSLPQFDTLYIHLTENALEVNLTTLEEYWISELDVSPYQQ